MATVDKNSRWFPTQQQLSDPSSLERSFRQMLSQHYELQRQFNELKAQMATSTPTTPATPASASPPGSGPADTQLLGLPVAPIDADRLANGATLKWNASKRNFSFQ